MDHDAETSIHSNQPQLRIYMTSKPIYFCVYRITNLVENKHYYGYKSSKIHPSKVIGVTYFSSLSGSEGKVFRKDQKKNPQNYKYKIVQIFNTHKEALAREIILHNKFEVGFNNNFYNKAKQTSTGFDTSGIPVMTYLDTITGDKIRLHIDDYHQNKDRFKPLAKGNVTVRDKNGNTFNVSKEDPRYISGELISALKGQITVYDEKTDTCFNVYKDDPRYITGELKHMNKIFTYAKDKDNIKIRVKKDDPRLISGILVGVKTGSKQPGANKGFIILLDQNGNNHRVSINDPRIESGELFSRMKGLLRVKNRNGDQIFIKIDDPRYISGEYIHWRRKFIN